MPAPSRPEALAANEFAAAIFRQGRQGFEGSRAGRVDTFWTLRWTLTMEPTPSIQFSSRESGGTGRRAGFRILWGKTRGGSSPPFRIRSVRVTELGAPAAAGGGGVVESAYDHSMSAVLDAVARRRFVGN